MLKRFLPILTFLVAVATVAAQIPETIAPLRPSVAPRVACNGAAKAGTTTRTLGLGARSNEKHYLCLGDTLFVSGSGQDLTEDPNPATVPGIGYIFYDCKPTVAGPEASDILADPCRTRRLLNGVNGSPYVARGDVSGRDTFFNSGALQRGFPALKPL